MDNVLSEYVEQYNRLIKREKKGSAYLDNPDVPEQEKEKWVGEFQKILGALNDLIGLIEKELGRNMTSEEILNGFTARKLGDASGSQGFTINHKSKR